MSINQVIDKLGGTTAVARHFNRQPSVVHGWRTAGSVAHWWVEPLLTLAQSKDVALLRSDIPVTPPKNVRAA